jgi:hypothetical protein
MRYYLFKGKRTDNGEWVEGHYYTQVYHEGTIEEEWYHFIKPIGSQSWEYFRVEPMSVVQYTEMNEFVVTDRSYNKPLFEGDIVEVWSKRRIPTSYYYSPSSSQYDIEVKARAVIRFGYGKWFLDYNNEYNKSLCELRGNEQIERTVEAWCELNRYRYLGDDEEWYREHNNHYKWNDIVKIGTVFENAYLLESDVNGENMEC